MKGGSIANGKHKALCKKLFPRAEGISMMQKAFSNMLQAFRFPLFCAIFAAFE